MEISSATLDDGKKCAQLLFLLKSGRWDLSASDIQVYIDTIKWTQEMASKIAGQVKGKAAPAAGTPAPDTNGIKVKAMGPLAVSSTPKRKRK